ncbi:hypothetical protein BOTBODRAFT_573119 [Botryobasidium botryosum FD-172 SS1]|uniref:Uncharacterized protein n=1 Tax=Botryobasidium botryosum (strain FD-172 SS1) TaxID=930990 RepID=A0A067M9B6_BOTB1|nr:hypothetical protein BOTBODRAFT_573119 [Botryobasidium botryosum FD-172 SS1]
MSAAVTQFGMPSIAVAQTEWRPGNAARDDDCQTYGSRRILVIWLYLRCASQARGASCQKPRYIRTITINMSVTRRLVPPDVVCRWLASPSAVTVRIQARHLLAVVLRAQKFLLISRLRHPPVPHRERSEMAPLNTRLNADVFKCIVDHIYDLHSINTILEAIPVTHPFLPVALKARCERPLLLRNESLEHTQHLIGFILSHQTWLAQSIRRLDLVFDPARSDSSTPLAPPPARLLELLCAALNLQEFSWCGFPGPAVGDSAILDTLGGLERLRSAIVDCSTGRNRERGVEDDHDLWGLAPFLSKLGPTLSSIEFIGTDEDAYKIIASYSASLVALHTLKLDLTRGRWDWDGYGSPQSGPSDEYQFQRLGCASRIRRFELIAPDLSLRALGGPLCLIDPSSLVELRLNVVHCFDWTPVRRIRSFLALNPKDFPRLRHLEIHDQTWNAGRMSWDRPDPRQFQESGRIYYGLHDFLFGLAGLERLWVDEKVLLVPERHIEDDAWASVVELLPARGSMQTSEWLKAAQCLGGLSSVRAGLGPLDAAALRSLVECCDATRLRQLGFEWDWHAYGPNRPLPQEFLDVVSALPLLVDIHILWPRPGAVDHHADLDTLADVRAIFLTCPHVCRVGIGKNIVWERALCPLSTGDRDHLPVMTLIDTRGQDPSRVIPDFFNSGFDPRPRPTADLDTVVDYTEPLLRTLSRIPPDMITEIV